MKKSVSTTKTTVTTTSESSHQLEGTLDDSNQLHSHGVYYMKKNQLYNPELFNGPSTREAMPSEGLYDLPEDPESSALEQQLDGGRHLYDDLNKSSDVSYQNLKVTTNIYDIPPDEDEECDAVKLQVLKDKFYESIAEEESEEEEDEEEDTRGGRQEDINEKRIAEAIARRRMENRRIGMERSQRNQTREVTSGVLY